MNEIFCVCGPFRGVPVSLADSYLSLEEKILADLHSQMLSQEPGIELRPLIPHGELVQL